MRGEYCVYGATVLSFISAVLLVFANISQLSSAPVVSNMYIAELNTFNMGAAYAAAAGGADGVYAPIFDAPMGNGNGLRHLYRYGVYGACGTYYTTTVCNSTMFGYPFQPLGNIQADLPTTRGLRDAALNLIGKDQALADGNYNQIMTRVANLLIFVGSALCGVALIVGVFKTRVTFAVAMGSSALSALLLMIGAAIWTAVIARNAPISSKMINADTNVGIWVGAGPALYIIWVAFAIQALSIMPYVISFLTFRKHAQGKNASYE